MGIDQLIGWYQKKIGTYDRQLWEKAIEQRIHRGLHDIRFSKNTIHLKSMGTKERDDCQADLKTKSAHFKTEFIDIDLVRGSSFTKAKPKHGIITVARLASLRFLLLPLYSKWWVQQTSGRIFLLLLSLYVLQLFNIAVYSYNTSKLPEDATEYVPCTEVVVPVIMMWVLSFIHSQIMATQSDHHPPSQTQKRKNFRRRRKSKIRLINKTSMDTNVQMHSNNNDELPKIKVFQKDDSGNAVNPLKSKEGNELFIDDGFESFNGNGSTPTVDDYKIIRNNPLSKFNDNEVIDSNGNNGSESDISNDENKENIEFKTKNIKWNEEKISSSGRNDRRHFRPNGKLKLNIVASKIEENRISPDTQGESTSWDSEEGETISTPDVGTECYPLLNEVTTSATDWMGVTTNTEDCSYSSELTCTSEYEPSDAEDVSWDTACAPSAILSPCCALSDKVSCTIWKKHEIRKVELSVFDISCQIVSRVEEMAESMDYFYIGVIYAITLSFLPALFRLSNTAVDSAISSEVQLTVVELSGLVLEKLSGSMIAIIDAAFGTALWERTVMVVALLQRFILACLFFFLLSVAERTFKQRFLYAKLFSHLTSSRRARKSQLPHFRLNKVRNIKTWLSVRSYLKKRGPQRSVDMIVSSAFIINLLLIFFLSMELLKDSSALRSQYNIEALFWCFGLGCLLLRFMTLGTKINRKYRSNLSILITEQINLYLQIEQKPHKKDELNVANSVLKLAADLLKELETPFKISGFSANPHLYTITKVFVLSALSGVLSEMLGFKLKLHKIKIK